jgi:Schlafen, AlbA_2
MVTIMPDHKTASERVSGRAVKHLRLARMGAFCEEFRHAAGIGIRDALRMTTWQSLLYCAAADVTLERIKNLVAVTGTEPLTVDFKEASTPAVAECAAAMANLHGGLILIGITDQDRKMAGVPREAIAYVADALATHLESPEWQPEMIEVPLDDGSGRYVLVLRVNADTAPRPVFVQLTARFSKEKRSIFWAPVRMPGSTRPATPDELRALFAEQRPAQAAEALWNLEAPRIPNAGDGTDDPAVDFALRFGLIVPAGAAGWGRPISERALGELAASLDHSALAGTLFRLTRFAEADVESFHPEGGANRSHAATMVSRLEPREPAAFEMTVRIEVPGHYGHSHVQALQLTLTLVSRLTARLNAGRPGMLPRRRLDADEWAALLDGVAATLTSPAVVGPVADLAGADPLTVRQPRVLHIVSGPAMPDLLPARLSPIRDGGVSHGAHMLADPALDLSDPAERAEQVDRWLIQMAADAGLRSMEQLVSKMRGDAARLFAVACSSARRRPGATCRAASCRHCADQATAGRRGRHRFPCEGRRPR